MAVTRLTTNGLTGTKYDIASADNYYMEPIATTLVGAGGSSNVVFSNIPQGYKDLQIRCLTKSSLAGPASAIGFQFNSITTGYFNHGIFGDGASVGAYSTTSSNNAGSLFIAGSSTTNMFGVAIIDVLDYASTNKNKTIRLLSGADFNGSGQVRFASGSFASTAPIVSLNLLDVNGGTISQHSRFSLYGIKG